MENFVKKYWWLLFLLVGISSLFITADPIDYCQKEQRFLSDEEYIQKAIEVQAMMLNKGLNGNCYPRSGVHQYIFSDINGLYEGHESLLRDYVKRHPNRVKVWRDKRHRYTTFSRLPINVRIDFIPDKKICQFILRNSDFEYYKQGKDEEPYDQCFQSPWIEKICIHEADKNLTEEVVGIRSWLLIKPCGKYGENRGSNLIYQSEVKSQEVKQVTSQSQEKSRSQEVKKSGDTYTMIFFVGNAYNFAMRYMRGSVRAFERGGYFCTVTCQENSWHVIINKRDFSTQREVG
ncbi:MAG: hypothetical protein AB7D43_12735 [Sulfurimonadaceae bacterium]|jgi:hypothetical protein